MGRLWSDVGRQSSRRVGAEAAAESPEELESRLVAMAAQVEEILPHVPFTTILQVRASTSRSALAQEAVRVHQLIGRDEALAGSFVATFSRCRGLSFRAHSWKVLSSPPQLSQGVPRLCARLPDAGPEENTLGDGHSEQPHGRVVKRQLVGLMLRQRHGHTAYQLRLQDRPYACSQLLAARANKHSAA